MSDLRKKTDSILIATVHSGYWAGTTVFSTFLVTYLYSRGFSATQVGLVVAFMSIFNLIFQPLWGYISDTKANLKVVIMLCLGVSIPLVWMMPFFTRTTLLLVCGCLAVACFEHPIKGLLDSLTNLAETRNDHIVYGVARGCGSFFSAVACLFIGDLLDAYGIELAFTVHGVLLGIGLIALALFSKESYEQPSISKNRISERITLKKAASMLLKDYGFVAVFISTILLNIGLKAALTFTPIMIVDLGGTGVHTGYAMAINTVGMLPCMLIYSWLYQKRRVSNGILYLWACLFTVVRIFSLALVDSLWPLVWIQILNSLSYGFLQPAMIRSISDVAPPELRATAITLVTGGHIAISSLLGDYIAGILIDSVGMTSMFWIGTLLGIIGTVAYFPVFRYLRKENHK